VVFFIRLSSVEIQEGLEPSSLPTRCSSVVLRENFHGGCRRRCRPQWRPTLVDQHALSPQVVFENTQAIFLASRDQVEVYRRCQQKELLQEVVFEIDRESLNIDA